MSRREAGADVRSTPLVWLVAVLAGLVHGTLLSSLVFVMGLWLDPNAGVPWPVVAAIVVTVPLLLLVVVAQRLPKARRVVLVAAVGSLLGSAVLAWLLAHPGS